MTSSHSEHSRPAPTDDDLRPGGREGLRIALIAVDCVVLALIVEGFSSPALLDDLEALDHPFDPDSWSVVGHARLLVVGSHPACAKPELNTAFTDVVECGDLLGQHDGMPVVVAEN